MTKEEQIKHIQEHITNDLLDGTDWRVEIDYQNGKLLTHVFHQDESLGDGYISSTKTINGIFEMDPPSAALVILNESSKLSVKWLELHLDLAIGFRDTIREGMDALFQRMKAEYEAEENEQTDDKEIKH